MIGMSKDRNTCVGQFSDSLDNNSRQATILSHNHNPCGREYKYLKNGHTHNSQQKIQQRLFAAIYPCLNCYNISCRNTDWINLIYNFIDLNS